MPLGRPKNTERGEYKGYEITVRFPFSTGAYLDKLGKGERAEFIREAVNEKIAKRR